MPGTMPNEQTVRVRPGDEDRRGYDVTIGASILAAAGGRIRRVLPRAMRAFLAVDAGVPDRVGTELADSVRGSGMAVESLSLRLDEEHKSLAAVESIVGGMLRAGVERGDVLVAIGGGLVGDVAGLAAAIYRRGIAWVACPTTLLAMVDASVGGKTAVNIHIAGRDGPQLRKNMAGAFHQPSLVLADVGTLSSLPAREIRCGLAECVKHGLIAADWGDPDLLDWTDGHRRALLALEPDALRELVARNIAVKAAVVAADERESGAGPAGGRLSLNLGHTFAHALEAIAAGALHHGEAVALGLIAASRCAESLEFCPRGLTDRLRRLIGPAGIGLPDRRPGLPDSESFMQLMRDDKKTIHNAVRLVLPTEPGRVTVVTDPPPSAIAAGLDAIRAELAP